MKKYLKALTILTCAMICAGEASARMVAPVFDATLTPQCAPWDGAAYGLRFELPATGQTFQASIYGEGIALLKDGKEFTLDQGTNSESTGYGNICEKTPEGQLTNCKGTKVTITIPSGLSEPGGMGTVAFPMDDESGREMILTIRVKIVEARPLCG